MAITVKVIGVSQLLGHMLGLPPKSTPMVGATLINPCCGNAS